jgi:hypothetical protein
MTVLAQGSPSKNKGQLHLFLTRRRQSATSKLLLVVGFLVGVGVAEEEGPSVGPFVLVKVGPNVVGLLPLVGAIVGRAVVFVTLLLAPLVVGAIVGLAVVVVFVALLAPVVGAIVGLVVESMAPHTSEFSLMNTAESN